MLKCRRHFVNNIIDAFWTTFWKNHWNFENQGLSSFKHTKKCLRNLTEFLNAERCKWSGGRLPRALFMVFLLDSKGASGASVRVHLEDLVKSFPTSICLQNLDSIQPRASPNKFVSSSSRKLNLNFETSNLLFAAQLTLSRAAKRFFAASASSFSIVASR